MGLTLARQFELSEETTAAATLGQLQTTVDAALDRHFPTGSRFTSKKRRNKADELELRVTHGPFMGELTFGVTVDMVFGQGGSRRMRVLHLQSRQENVGARKATAARESMQAVGGVLGCAFIAPIIALVLGAAYYFLANGRSPGVAVVCLVAGGVFGLPMGRALGRLMGGAEVGGVGSAQLQELKRGQEAWKSFEDDLQRTVVSAGIFREGVDAGAEAVLAESQTSTSTSMATQEPQVQAMAALKGPEIAELTDDLRVDIERKQALVGFDPLAAAVAPVEPPTLVVGGVSGERMIERHVCLSLDDRAHAELLGRAVRDLTQRLRDQHLPAGKQFVCESAGTDPDRLQLHIRRGDFHGTVLAGLRRDAVFEGGKMQSHWVVGVEADYVIESLQAADRVSRGVEDWFRSIGATLVAMLGAVLVFKGLGIGGSAGAVAVLGSIMGGGWLGGKIGEMLGDLYSAYRERGAQADTGAAEAVELWINYLKSLEQEFCVVVRARENAGR